MKPLCFCPGNGFFQQGARANFGCGTPGYIKIGKKKRKIIFPGYFSFGAQVHHGLRIGVAGMPAGYLGIIVGIVACIPAEYYIAKAKAFFGNAFKFFEAYNFATEDAIYIGDSEFYFSNPNIF